MAALSVKGPLIFSSSSSCCLSLAIFFLLMLRTNHTITKIANNPAKTPMAIPAFAATLMPSPPSVPSPDELVWEDGGAVVVVVGGVV